MNHKFKKQQGHSILKNINLLFYFLNRLVTGTRQRIGISNSDY